MLSGCRILQYLTAVVIFLIVVIMVMALSSDTGLMTGFTLFTGAINIGLMLVIFKVYMDCAKRQDILEKYKISVKPSELDKALAEKFKQ